MTQSRRLICSITGALLAVAILSGCGPGTAPAGQPPMVLLGDNAALDSLREQFNKAADRTRVIVLLSPT